MEGASGSTIAAFKVRGNASVWAGQPCALSYRYRNANITLQGPADTSDGWVAPPPGTNYFEIRPQGPAVPSGVRMAGATQDAAGCRGVCETTPGCTSYTWDARQPTRDTTEAGAEAGAGESVRSQDTSSCAAGQGIGGSCFTRNDSIWAPNVTGAGPCVASGRPWAFDGDNPVSFGPCSVAVATFLANKPCCCSQAPC